MSTEARQVPSGQRTWPEALAIALSLMAIVISAYALIAAREQHQDERSSETLDALFEDWDNLAVALTEHWEIKHIDEPPATYYTVRDQLRLALAPLPEAEQLRVLMLERALAGRMLAMFEHSHKQWLIAREAGDASRLALLDIEMDYWTHVQLRNPRLLWYWSEAGGGLRHQADPPTLPFYDARVLNDPRYPLTVSPDPEGVVPGVNQLLD